MYMHQKCEKVLLNVLLCTSIFIYTGKLWLSELFQSRYNNKMAICAGHLWLSELCLSRYDIRIVIQKLDEIFV